MLLSSPCTFSIGQKARQAGYLFNRDLRVFDVYYNSDPDYIGLSQKKKKYLNTNKIKILEKSVLLFDNLSFDYKFLHYRDFHKIFFFPTLGENELFIQNS